MQSAFLEERIAGTRNTVCGIDGQLNTELNYGFIARVVRMKIPDRQAKEITPLLRAAVQSQIECWRYQGEIERNLGVYFKNMERAVQDLAAAGDPEAIDGREVQETTASLEVESVTSNRARRSKTARSSLPKGR